VSDDKKLDELNLEIWKKVVDVQMHFNDLELRIRNYAILSLGATMTVAGYSLKASNTVHFGCAEIPYASIVMLMGAVIWLCFWFMDRHWYHRLLMGSVLHGIKIENDFEALTPAIALSESIKEESPNKFLMFKVRSHHRLNIFYWLIAILFVTVALALISVVFATVFVILASALFVIISCVALEEVKSSID
jgi:hypothetical protein